MSEKYLGEISTPLLINQIKENCTQKRSTLPIASIDELGNTYQYTGTTSGSLVHGYFYECVSDGQDPATYSWVALIDFGTAALKNSTDRVSPNNTALVESQSVYSAINTALSSIYTPRGDITCAELTSDLLIEANVGNIYETSDSGTTTTLFLQGAGVPIATGSNVGIINAGQGRILFNLMANAFDLTDYQKKDLTQAVEGETTVEGALGALSTNKQAKTLTTSVESQTTVEGALGALSTNKQDSLTFDNVPTENSNNPVKSGGIYADEKSIYEVMGRNGAKNKEPFDIDVAKALNTTGTWTGNSYELNGITFAFADDGKVTVSGTASALCSINISGNYDLNGDYIITGCPSGGGSSTYSLRIYDSSATVVADDVGEGISFTANNLANCRTNLIVRKDAAISTPIVFAPMIRDSKDTDPTYQPYAKTNHQLTEDTTALLDNLEVNGAVNMLPNTMTTQTVNGITFTVNDDGTITASGTATANAILNISTITLDAGTYNLTGCPSEGGASKYYLNISVTSGTTGITAEDKGNGAIFTLIQQSTIIVKVRVISGQTVSNLTFYPMITVPSYNGDYVPYAKSNKELTEDVTSLDAMYDGKTPSAVSDLNVPLTAGGASVAITRHLNNTTNAPTNGGGLEITWSSSDRYGAQLTLTDSGLYFRTNSSGTISAWQKIST